MTTRTCQTEGCNPPADCRCDVELLIEAGIVKDVRFLGKNDSCAQHAALIVAQLTGKPVLAVEGLFDTVHEVLTGTTDRAQCVGEMGRLVALSGVARFPVRERCVQMAGQALLATLGGNIEQASARG